ncbi:MAG: ABC transporter substrate-binding protein [Chloroflexi bacterium]|nr:ABC transporter substrate-binding protein [Chloroflexota bacterium]
MPHPFWSPNQVLPRLFAALIAAGVILAGCQPAAAPAPTAAPTAPAKAAPATTPKPAGVQPRYGGALPMAHNSDPASFDVHQESSISVLNPLGPAYNMVVQFDAIEYTKIVGDLAKTWSVSADGRDYAFELNENVKWHDGKPLAAEDVKFSLDRQRDPPRGVRSPRMDYLEAISKVEAPDNRRVIITLKRPSASFISTLADGFIVIMPKHVIEAKGDVKKDVVGTGPFMFQDYTRGVSMKYKKNPNYFVAGRPYLDALEFYIIRDAETRLSAFLTGRVLMTARGTQGFISSEQRQRAERDLKEKIVTWAYWNFGTATLYMSNIRAPWSDARVRRAADMVIDRQDAIKALGQGTGVLGYIYPAGSPWALPEAETAKWPYARRITAQDIAEARKLLAEAGHPNGFKTTLLNRAGGGYAPRGVFAKDQLAKIGIDVTLDTREEGAYFADFREGKFDIAIGGSVPFGDDPDYKLLAFFKTGAVENAAQFSDREVDRLLEEQAVTLDLEKRKQLVWDLQRRIQAQAPVALFYHLMAQLGAWKTVHNAHPGLGIHSNQKLQETWLEK